MTTDRRDNKGRKLQSGESQRSDGRYSYRYNDINGVRREIYSWRLVESDKTPKGKRVTPALRTLISQVNKDIEKQVDSFGGKNVTLNDIFYECIISKLSMRESTRTQYLYQYNKFVKNEIGNMFIRNIKYSTLKAFYSKIFNEQGASADTISKLNSLIRMTLDVAVNNEWIPKNPATSIVSEIKSFKKNNDKPCKRLTVEEQNAFVRFCETDKISSRYANLIKVLLGTGMRISEAIGLIWSDCDFDNNLIHVNRTLNSGVSNGKSYQYIGLTKTTNGVRTIPMLPSVKQALLNEKSCCENDYGFCETEIDGVTGFVFTGVCLRKPLNRKTVNEVFKIIVKKYNKKELERALKENREPFLLPNITPHMLRHTFCSRLCENNVNIKVIQSVMGHSNISITMNVYTELSVDKIKSEFSPINDFVEQPS